MPINEQTFHNNIFAALSNPKILAITVIALVAIVAVAIAVPLAVNSGDENDQKAEKQNAFFGRTVLDEVPLIDG